MLKKISLSLIVLAVCTMAFAADPSAAVAAKVTAVDQGSITVALDGEKPAWVKKNAPVKFKDGVGKVLEVNEDASPVVVKIKTRKASAMKAGDAITFQKGKAMAGC